MLSFLAISQNFILTFCDVNEKFKWGWLIMDEKRRYQRVKNELNIKIDLIDDQDNNAGINIGKSANVSASGVLIKYYKPLEVSSIVNVRFLKPGSFDFFEGKARVVRLEMNIDNKTYDIGVQFIGLTNEDENKLNYYLTL